MCRSLSPCHRRRACNTQTPTPKHEASRKRQKRDPQRPRAKQKANAEHCTSIRATMRATACKLFFYFFPGLEYQPGRVNNSGKSNTGRQDEVATPEATRRQRPKHHAMAKANKPAGKQYQLKRQEQSRNQKPQHHKLWPCFCVWFCVARPGRTEQACDLT